MCLTPPDHTTMDLSQLLALCEHVDKLPGSIAETEAQSFLHQAPLGAVFELLSSAEVTQQQLDTVCTALTKVLATQHGTALLPAARQYAQAALASPHHRLRRLGCEQLGRLLLAVLTMPAAAAAAAAAGASAGDEQQLLALLVKALQDEVTGVAAAAEAGIVAAAAAAPAVFSELLSGASAAGAALQQQLGERSSATHRMRAFALLAAAAGTSSAAAQQLRDCGVVQQLLQQLSPGDPLSCLVSLQLLQELVPHLGSSAAGVLQGMLLPALLPLLDDPATSAGAFRIAAQLAAAAAAAAGGAPAAANGNGVAHDSSGPADVLLSKMAAVLDDRGAAGPDEEVVVLDAAHHLALPSPASAALLAAPAAAGLLQSVCSKALGRTTPPEVRLAALHALASAAGLERAGEARDRSAALLPQAAEERLRQGVYGAVAGAAGGVGGARTPAEAVWQLLQQPFGDMRAAVYRCCSALALHAWFAADVASNSGLLARLCSTDSESGRQACEWRHSAVMALWASVQYMTGLPDDAPEAVWYKARLTEAARQQLAVAVRGGPYGVGGGRATQQSHEVATIT